MNIASEIFFFFSEAVWWFFGLGILVSSVLIVFGVYLVKTSQNNPWKRRRGFEIIYSAIFAVIIIGVAIVVKKL